MTKELWINLPVRDLNKSKEFFTELGFNIHLRHESAVLSIGDKNTIVMLFPESVFKGFTGNDLSDPKEATEVLLSVGVDSREEVDEMVKKVVHAGGTIFGEPKESQGWMYGAGFADLDGHRWNVLYMDMDKMPKG